MLSHQPSAISHYVYVEFVNDKKSVIVRRQIFVVNPDISGERNHKAVSPKQSVNISFYPEGGNLIAGQTCHIAFKALDSQGNALNIQGEILDSNDRKITDFNTSHEGMGIFFLQPEPEEMYYAVTRAKDGEQEIKISLPEAKSNTFALKTTWRQNKLWIAVNKSPEKSWQKIYLLVHSKGHVIFAGKWDTSNEFITIDKKISRQEFHTYYY